MLRWRLINDNQGSFDLLHDPINWQEVELNLTRSEKYFGVFYEWGQQVTFTERGGGAEFIQACFENERYWEADIEALVFDDNVLIFRGKLDMPTARKTRDGWDVKIEQGGIVSKLLTRDDVPVALNATESIEGVSLSAQTFAPYTLNMHSVKIRQRSRLDSNAFSDVFNFNYVTGLVRNFFFNLPLDITENELKTVGQNTFIFQPNQVASSLVVTSPNLNLQPIFTANDYSFVDYPINVTIDYDIDGAITIANIDLATVQIGIGSITIRKGQTLESSTLVATLTTNTAQTTSAANIVVNHAASGTLSTSVNGGESLWVILFLPFATTAGTGNDQFDISADFTNSDGIVLTADTEKAATTANAYAIHEATARVLEVITDTPDVLNAQIFGRTNSQPRSYGQNGCHSFYALTNGYQIRGANASDKPPTVTLNDLFDSLNAIFNLALGLNSNGEITIGLRNDYLNSTPVLTIPDNPLDIEFFIADDNFYNQLRMEYAKYGVNDVQGLQDVHGFREWVQDNMSKIQEVLGLKSDLVASMYIIEVTRRRSLIEFPSTDSNFDEDNFIIALNRSVDGNGDPDSLDVAEKDENTSATANLPFPDTTYNLRITPTRNAIRHYDRLTASMDYFGGKYKYQTGEINDEFESTFTTDCPGDVQNRSIEESTDIDNVTSFGDRGKIGVFGCSFSYPLTPEQWAVIRNNPEGLISVGTAQGYVKNISYSISKRIANFELWLV